MSYGPPSDLVRLVAVAVRPHAHLSAGVRTSSLTVLLHIVTTMAAPRLHSHRLA